MVGGNHLAIPSKLRQSKNSLSSVCSYSEDESADHSSDNPNDPKDEDKNDDSKHSSPARA